MTTPSLRLNNPNDLLDAIPPLLGFMPEESLVALIIHESGRLVVTARIDLSDAISAAEDLCGTLTRHGNRAILAAYTARPDHAAPEVARFAELIDVAEAIATDGRRWWSLTCDRDCCPTGGSPLPDQASVTAVTLVAQGLDTLPNRAALADRIAPPAADQHAALAAAYTAAEQHHHSSTNRDQTLIVTRFVDRYTATADAPTPHELAALTVAINADLTLRDIAWAHMDHSTATHHARLWAHVVRHTHPDHSAPALGLYGFACWLSGNGAGANTAAEALSERHPGYSLGHLLTEVLDRAIPPTAWTTLASDMRAALPH